MAAKLLIQQGGVTRELSAQDFNSVQYDTQAGTRYELLDDYGNVIRDYTTRVENGKLLIDVAGTSASPDFILNNYTSYFPAPASGGMGSGYFGTAAAESAASTAVKASTVGATSSAGGGALLGGLLGLAAIGGIAAAASGGSSKDKDNTANSGSQATPSTNTNTGNQAVPSNTNKNTASTNTTSTTPSNNSGSQTTPSTDKNTGSTNTTNTAPNNTGSQTASNTNTDKNTAGTNTTSTTPSNNSGSQTAPNTNTDKNTGTNNTAPTDNSGSQNPATPSTKDVLHGNSIKLPTAYTQKVLGGTDLNAITKAATGGVEMNQYQSSEANKKIIINDLNNLSREVQTELSLFVAGLLNPIRKQWNVGALKVTDGSMNFAQDVANEYTSNNVAWGTLKGHYVQGITKAAAKYGLNTGGQYYENIGWYGSQVTKMTLDDLKKHLYDIVVFMLFDDARSNHGHAKSLLNAMNFHNQDLDTDYFGVDTSNMGKEGWNLHLIHATDNDAYVTDRATFTAKIQTPEITAMPTPNAASANTGNGEAALGLATVGGVAAATNQDQNTGSQTAPNTNTDKNTGTNNTAPTDNSGSQNPATPSTKDVLHGNSIKLPTAYTQKVLGGTDLNAITKAATGGVEMNKYQSNAENKKIIISDLNNLSREVQTELSLFVAGLLNPIRKQWHVGTLKVTDGAMNFAKDVADTYTSDKKSIFLKQGHYVAGITRAAAKYGLDTENNWYENLGGFKTSAGLKNLSLDDLKHHVYNSVVSMLFDDAHSDHGHAKSLLNAMKYADQNAATDYLGVDTSNAFGDELNMHFIQATDHRAYIDDQAKFAATIATPEITSMPATKTSPRMVYLDDDNSHLSTTQFGESDDSAPQITQKFTFSQLLEGNVRQLADEYDENDVLALSQNAFSALNKDQSNLHEHISYDSATGLLSYDADGVSGSISPVAFAQLAQGLQQEQIQFEIL